MHCQLPMGAIHDVHHLVDIEDDIWEYKIDDLLPHPSTNHECLTLEDFHRLVSKAYHELCGTVIYRKEIFIDLK